MNFPTLNPCHEIIVDVSFCHRFNKLPHGEINKYIMAQELAQRLHPGSVDGGAWLPDARRYDIFIYMPKRKVARFKQNLRAFNISFTDYGVWRR